MTKPALTIESLHKNFGQFQVLQDVNLSVNEGEFLALLGHSGCGKTTLLRLLAGFEELNEGQISLRDKVIAKKSFHLAPEKRQVGLVFQDYALFPHLSVKKNILFGVKENPDQALDEMLELLDLKGQENKMPYELSGGQQQRVAIARALAPKPDVILLDEPFSNLDSFLRREVRQQMKEILKKAGVTAILVTHDQEEAFQFADRVAVMNKGKILQCASAEELYLEPNSSQVAEFLGNSQFIDVTIDNGVVSSSFGQFKVITTLNGAAQLLVRPESFNLEKEGQTSVISRHFNGGVFHYIVESEGQRLRVDSSLNNKLEVGDKVSLIQDNELIVFPKT